MNDKSNEVESWLELGCLNAGDPPLLGYLQLCADRRFHKCIQDQFQEDAKLDSPYAYWIHADAGGTPKMECQRIAPDYCYYKKCVRLMGWSAHGNGCGGFGEEVPDEVIRAALDLIAGRKVEEYPEADHFVYFATLTKKGDKEEAVVYCKKHKKKAD